MWLEGAKLRKRIKEEIGGSRRHTIKPSTRKRGMDVKYREG